MIEEKLIEEDAKRLGITVSQSDIDKAIDQLAFQMEIPRSKLPEIFKSEGINFHKEEKFFGFTLVLIKIDGLHRKHAENHHWSIHLGNHAFIII